MDPFIIKEYKPRMKDKSLTNHWTLQARKFISVQAEYYKRNVENIREKNRLRYANSPEVREKKRERSHHVLPANKKSLINR
jgi:hypothetical protein